MQTPKQQGQAAKGSAPLAFQLSSPPKLARQNVLAAIRPHVFDKVDAVKGLSESSSAASGKSRPKKSRWGPDQLVTSPPPTTGQAPLPALGFKGVNSHRPPGLLLPSKPGTSASSVAAKPASANYGAVTQPDPVGHRPPQESLTAKQSVARTHTVNKDAEVVQRSSHRPAGSSRSPEANTASQVPSQTHASSSSNRLLSDRERSRQAKGSEIAERRRISPSPGAAVHGDRARASSVENGYTETQPRARNRNEAARHPHQKQTRHSDEYRKHRQAGAEGRLHISPAGSDALHAHSREHRSSRGYQREENEGWSSIVSETRESDRRRGSYVSRNVDSDKRCPKSQSPASGSKRPRQPRHRSPSHEEEGQIMERSFDRPHKLLGTGPKQPHRKLDLGSAHNLPDPASSERSMHSASIAAPAPVAPTAEGKPAMGLQQAAQSHQPLQSSDDKLQVQAAPGGETHSEPLQATPAADAASATLLAASKDAVMADGKATRSPSAHLPGTVKHVDADARQQPQPVTQEGGHRMSDAPPPNQSIANQHQGSGPLASASQEDQKMAVPSTNVQGLRYRAVTPSGSRQAPEHQQHPRRRREFHDEPKPPGPGRKRSQTPEVEFGRDAKPSRHAWHPTPAHASHAEHRGPSQGAPRYDAHRGASSFSTKQSSASLVAPGHRYRDSQSPTPRSAGRESVAVAAHDGMAPPGRRADTTRSMSMSPSHANSTDPLPGHLHGGAPGHHTAPHGRTWDPEVHHHSRGNAPQPYPPRFDRQQDHGKASWSNKEYSKATLLPRDNSHHRDHHSEFDRRSRSTDRATHGKDMLRQRHSSKSEHEAAAMSRAHKLDSDLDHMFAWLLSAYERSFEAMGDKLVLQQMSSSVKLTEHIDGDGDDADDNGKAAFTATRQSLPGWLHGVERQQLSKMLVPADWLTQDPQFQPRQRLPLGWCPPECTRESARRLSDSLDEAMQDVKNTDWTTLCDVYPVTIPWQADEVEAGEVAEDTSKDPRSAARPALPSDFVMPMPLFPFLPEGEAPLSLSDISPDHGQGKAESDKGEKRVDQLAPGGFLYDYWDMAHRPPSPAGSWSSSPTRHSGWGAESAGAWGPTAYLEPPAAPKHFTDTEQPYVEHVTTTALLQGSEMTVTRRRTAHPLSLTPQNRTTYPRSHYHPHCPTYSAHQSAEMPDQHSRLAAGHSFDVHQQQQHHWQQQQQVSPTPGHPRPPQPPLTPQLQCPGHYPEPESAHFRLQFGDYMSTSEYGLVQLRQEMAQGREDARPGTSLQNKAEGYWVPLQQGHWKPEHLHWEGIDQMLMQGARTWSEALDVSPTGSERELGTWLAETAESSQQRLHPNRQLSQQTSDFVMSQPEDLINSAMAGDDELHVACPSSMSQASSATDFLPDAPWDSSADSDQWFDKLDLAAARKSSAGPGTEGRSDHAEAGRRGPCWGPLPPPQYPAMLRGELALAVMTGVAGKSLLKEVLDRAIQLQLDGTKGQ